MPLGSSSVIPRFGGRIWRQVIALHKVDRIEPLVHRVFPFDRAVEAFGALVDRTAIGKVLVSCRS